MINFILCIKECPPPTVALPLQRPDQFLTLELRFQRQRSSRRASRLLDLPVHLLDLALQGHLQVVGPTIQLRRFLLEERGVAGGDSPADGFLPLGHDVLEPRVRLAIAEFLD